MSTINVSLPSDGETIDAADYNTPINTIVNEFNGNIDNNNIKTAAAISGSKLADTSIDINAKTSVWDGWIQVSDSWSYASATTITVPTDATTKYSKGDYVKLVQSATTKYFRIKTVAATLLTVEAQTNGVSVANSAITGIQYSKTVNPVGAPLAGVPWWEEIGRTTLSGAGDTITVSSLPARKYLYIVVTCLSTGGTINPILTFNSDAATNYAVNRGNNFATVSSSVSQNGAQLASAAGAYPMFISMSGYNIATSEKGFAAQSFEQNTAGANAPQNRFTWLKWSNTSAQISRIDITNTGTGDFAIGSEIIVLGHD